MMLPKRTQGCFLRCLLITGVFGKDWLDSRGSLPSTPSANYEVIQRFPHEKACFTEGLSLNGSGPEVIESCGLTGQSYLRRYELQSGKTKQQVPLERRYFGEGAVLFETSLLVLTYQHKEMLELDAKTLKTIRTHPFPYGEGWGLTTDGCDLLATTGSEYIFRLRRDSTGQFALVNKVKVTHKGRAMRMLNEVEYITPKLWVNEWYTNRVWRVDPMTGNCELQIDIGKLYNWGRSSATPNGLAYSPSLGEDVLLVTGKLWPEMFALRMKVQDLCGSALDKVTCPAAPRSACWHGGAAGVAPPAAPAAAVAAPAVAAPPAAPPAAAALEGEVGMVEATPPVVLPRGIAVVSSLLGFMIFCVASASAFLIRFLRSRKREMMYKHRLDQVEDDA